MDGTTDRIEKQVLLRAPQARVWRAITDAREFGAWFGVKLDGPFEQGAIARGRIVPTTVDPAVAEAQRPYEGIPFVIEVTRAEPMGIFAFRWHPFAIDPDVDYSQEPMTLVTFALTPESAGTRLTITEEGFASIPLERRAAAFDANDGGWAASARLLAKFLGV